MKMPCECATWPRPPQVPHGAGCEPGLPPDAAALLAVHQARELERLLTTLGRLAQRDRQLLLQVVAGLDARPALLPAAAEAAEAAPPKKSANCDRMSSMPEKPPPKPAPRGP